MITGAKVGRISRTHPIVVDGLVTNLGMPSPFGLSLIEDVLHLFQHVPENLQVLVHGVAIVQRVGQIAASVREVGIQQDAQCLEQVLLRGFSSMLVYHKSQFPTHTDNADNIQLHALVLVEIQLRKRFVVFCTWSGYYGVISYFYLLSVRKYNSEIIRIHNLIIFTMLFLIIFSRKR